MKTGRLYNSIQEIFSRVYSLTTGREPRPLRSLLVEECKELSPKKILDVGCGSGSYALSSYDYLGIDPNPNYIAYCCQHRSGVFQQMSAERLNFPANTFDVIFCFGVGHHLSDASFKAACSEIKRVLTHDGVFLFADPVRPILKSRVVAALLEWVDEGRWFRNEDQYVDLLQHEFEIVRKRQVEDQFYRTLVFFCRKTLRNATS